MFNIESSQISRLDSYGKYMFLAARRSPGIPPPSAPPVLNAGKTQVCSRTTHPRSATRAARVRDSVTGHDRNTGPSPLVDINSWRDSLQYNTSVYSISRCPPKGSAPQSGRGTEPPDRGSRRDRGEEASERAQIYRRRSLANAPSFIAGARRGQIGTTATRHRARPLCYLRLTEGATTIY